jgi:serine/threonine-protein kinase
MTRPSDAELATLLSQTYEVGQTMTVAFKEGEGYTLQTNAQARAVVQHDRDSSSSEAELDTLSSTFGPALLSKERHATLQSDAGQLGSASLSARPRFEVMTALGRGSFGEVWQARDSDIGRAVALKHFLGTKEQATQSCIEELRFTGRLDHHGIPTVYQVGLTERGSPYITMQLLEGEPLQALINRLKKGDAETHKAYNFHRRVDLIIQLLRIIDVAHKSGVLHRDIKPENIFVNPAGEVTLLDWGIAAELKDVREGPNAICGTPVYMAPEQAKGEGLSEATDLYSAGAVAYELLSLTIAAPTEGTVWDILSAIPTYQPPTIYLIQHPAQGACPIEFRDPVMRSIRRRPEERYQDASEMIMDLQRALSGDLRSNCAGSLLKKGIFQLNVLLNRHPYGGATLLYTLLLFFVMGLVSIGMTVYSFIIS